MKPHGTPAPTNETAVTATIVHREVIRLTLLIAAALAAFVFTRAVAATSRNINRSDAAAWFARGQQEMAASQLDGALASFRRASTKDPSEPSYALALAEVLVRKQDYASAETVLLGMRESAPEDATINLQLARLDAKRQDVTGAVRSYHNALYSPWSSERVDLRRTVRVELVRFLLDHQQQARAISELLVLATDLPDTSPAHVELAGLFAQAGDTQRALDQFTAALRIDPANSAAAAGAGRVAFALGNYELAQQYLVTASTEPEMRLRDVTSFVLDLDPLANKLSAAERFRRLTDAFMRADDRLSGCIRPATAVGAPSRAGDQTLVQDADAFKMRLMKATREPDMIDDGLDLIYRIERTVIDRCPPEARFDEAMILIGRRHGAGR